MTVTAARGFLAGGRAAGIKASGAPDLALVACRGGPVPAAATFTTNRAAAAPVVLSRSHLATTGGMARAVVLNSGCANAATGPEGEEAARATAQRLAELLDARAEEVLVCSTGLIGIPLPTEALLGALPGLVAGLGATPEHGRAAAEAIMTTDTHPKEVLVSGGDFAVGGMAKGAGMIAPNMATMLAVLTTDAALSPEALAQHLRGAVEASFNALIVDGCTSTNDSVCVLASGEAGPVDDAAFAAALTEACSGLAYQLADDAEGTTKVVRITVSGARDDADARLAARGVADSLLVKTSLYGADPYWGRIVSELGASGAAFELGRCSVAYGSTTVFAGGREVAHDAAALAAHLAGSQVDIDCDLGLGAGRARVLSTDLGHGYIDENMRTS